MFQRLRVQHPVPGALGPPALGIHLHDHAAPAVLTEPRGFEAQRRGRGDRIGEPRDDPLARERVVALFQLGPLHESLRIPRCTAAGPLDNTFTVAPGPRSPAEPKGMAGRRNLRSRSYNVSLSALIGIFNSPSRSRSASAGRPRVVR